MSKQRVTVTVDSELVQAAGNAVKDGRTESVSAWVSEAMADRLARDRRLELMADLIDEYERHHGVIIQEEIEEQRQTDRDQAALYRNAALRRTQ